MDAVDRRRASLDGVVILAGFVVVLAGASALRGLIGPAFLGLVLIVALDPVRSGLEHRGLARPLAEAVRLGLIVVVLAGLIWALAASVAALAGLLPSYSPDLDHLRADIEAALVVVGIDRGQVSDLLSAIDLSSVLQELRPVFGGATSAASGLLLLLGVLFFVGFEGTSLEYALRRASEPSVALALGRFASRTRRFFVVTTLFGLLVAAVDVLILMGLGVPAALEWGLLAFVTNYIPNVGFVIGLAPPAMLAFLGGGVAPALAVIGAYSVVNFVLQSLVQPKVVGEAVDLTATATFLSLVFWTIVLGPLGGLLAVPLTLFVDAVFLESRRPAPWLSAVLHGRPTAGVPTGAAGDVAASGDPGASRA